MGEHGRGVRGVGGSGTGGGVGSEGGGGGWGGGEVGGGRQGGRGGGRWAASDEWEAAAEAAAAEAAEGGQDGSGRSLRKKLACGMCGSMRNPEDVSFRMTERMVRETLFHVSGGGACIAV